MTDTPGSTPPFPGFPSFSPTEMLERMWGMMRLSPLGSGLPGAQAGAGFSPSLSMMSDMMAPLTNVEELDKRITDMRAVEQWLKLNLSMLQSAIQALEVQRATLATLRAFGAFAQASMTQPQGAGSAAAATPPRSPAPSGWPHPEAPKDEPAAAQWSAHAHKADEGDGASAASEASESSGSSESSDTPPFDASAWWNLLQSQFNQIAQFAMTQPGAAAGSQEGGSPTTPSTDDAHAPGADAAATRAGRTDATAKRPAAKRAGASTKRASASAGGTRATKKTP
jgi:hypothetical protein